MQPDMRDEPRSANDSRKRMPVETGKVETVQSKPSLGERWRNAQPTKTTLFWACLTSIILTIVVGFTWGGWVTAGSAQKTAQTMANDAVIQRLAPICIAQFNQDPDKALKLDEMNGLVSRQRAQYVQDQGWATISGEEVPDRKVVDACTKLLLEISP
jgi:hypothetical protein